MTGYSQAANKRGRGFGVQAGAAILLWLGALGAIIWRLVHG
jgi:glutathione S-transferase